MFEENVRHLDRNELSNQVCGGGNEDDREKKEVVEKEYDEDYKRFTEYANDNGYTRQVTVDKYVDLSNKKLQVAQFRYTVVNKMMEENGVGVDEANQEFDKMMNAMNQQEEVCNGPMCIKCD